MIPTVIVDELPRVAIRSPRVYSNPRSKLPTSQCVTNVGNESSYTAFTALEGGIPLSDYQTAANT